MMEEWQGSALTLLTALMLAGSATWGYWQTQQRLEDWLQAQRQPRTQLGPVSPQARQQLAQLASRQALQSLKPEQWAGLPERISNPDIRLIRIKPGRIAKASSVGAMRRDELPIEVSAWVRHEESLAQLLDRLAQMPGLVDVTQCSLTRVATGGIEVGCSLVASAVGAGS
jgi:hypothetical protein